MLLWGGGMGTGLVLHLPGGPRGRCAPSSRALRAGVAPWNCSSPRTTASMPAYTSPMTSSNVPMLARPVRVGIRLKDWKTKPVRSRRSTVRSWPSRVERSWSPMKAEPEVSESSPPRQCSSVDPGGDDGGSHGEPFRRRRSVSRSPCADPVSLAPERSGSPGTYVIVDASLVPRCDRRRPRSRRQPGNTASSTHATCREEPCPGVPDRCAPAWCARGERMEPGTTRAHGGPPWGFEVSRCPRRARPPAVMATAQS